MDLYDNSTDDNNKGLRKDERERERERVRVLAQEDTRERKTL